jgi:ribosomal RNA-processing protein 12
VQGFTAPFAQLLSQLLYTQPLLRPPILRALSTLVTSMQTLSRSSAPSEELLASFGVDQADAEQSVAYLKGFAGEMLAVLFNVFSSVAREQRGMVGDVIGQWLSIMTEKVSSRVNVAVSGADVACRTSRRRTTRSRACSRPP